MGDKSFARKTIERLALQKKWKSEIQDYDEVYSTIDEHTVIKGLDAELGVSFNSDSNIVSLTVSFSIKFSEGRLNDVCNACNYANRNLEIGAFTFLKEYAAGPAKIGHFVMAGPSIQYAIDVSLGEAAKKTGIVDIVFDEMTAKAKHICEDWIDIFISLSKSKKTLESLLAGADKYTPGITVLKI